MWWWILNQVSHMQSKTQPADFYLWHRNLNFNYFLTISNNFRIILIHCWERIKKPLLVCHIISFPTSWFVNLLESTKCPLHHSNSNNIDSMRKLKDSCNRGRIWDWTNKTIAMQVFFEILMSKWQKHWV